MRNKKLCRVHFAAVMTATLALGHLPVEAQQNNWVASFRHRRTPTKSLTGGTPVTHEDLLSRVVFREYGPEPPRTEFCNYLTTSGKTRVSVIVEDCGGGDNPPRTGKFTVSAVRTGLVTHDANPAVPPAARSRPNPGAYLMGQELVPSGKPSDLELKLDLCTSLRSGVTCQQSTWVIKDYAQRVWDHYYLPPQGASAPLR